MKWISVKEHLPEEGTYCLIMSNCGWIGLEKYSKKDQWCSTGFPDVIIDNIIYDVPNDQITHYMPLSEIELP